MPNIQKARFEIIAVPQGDAPLWVREAWLGVIVDGYVGFERGEALIYEVVSGNPVEEYEGVNVLQFEALTALKEKNEEAYHWWIEARYPHGPLSMFIFRKDEMRAVSEFETLLASPEDYDKIDPLPPVDDNWIKKDDHPF